MSLLSMCPKIKIKFYRPSLCAYFSYFEGVIVSDFTEAVLINVFSELEEISYISFSSSFDSSEAFF